MPPMRRRRYSSGVRRVTRRRRTSTRPVRSRRTAGKTKKAKKEGKATESHLPTSEINSRNVFYALPFVTKSNVVSKLAPRYRLSDSEYLSRHGTSGIVEQILDRDKRESQNMLQMARAHHYNRMGENARARGIGNTIKYVSTVAGYPLGNVLGEIVSNAPSVAPMVAKTASEILPTFNDLYETGKFIIGGPPSNYGNTEWHHVPHDTFDDFGHSSRDLVHIPDETPYDSGHRSRYLKHPTKSPFARGVQHNLIGGMNAVLAAKTVLNRLR